MGNSKTEASLVATQIKLLRLIVYLEILQTLTTRDCKGPQTNMPENGRIYKDLISKNNNVDSMKFCIAVFSLQHLICLLGNMFYFHFLFVNCNTNSVT